MQIKVPLGGSNITAEGEGPPRNGNEQTPAQRKSLHSVRVPTQTVAADYEPKWDDKGHVKWVPVPQETEQATEEPAETYETNGNGNGSSNGQPYDVLQQQIQQLNQTVMSMSQMLGQPAQPQGPQPPNPEDFDFYEPKQVADFHRLNNAYIQATVQQSVQAALDPHRDTMKSAEYSRQYNNVLADHGNDPNFKPFMDKAIQLVVNSNEKFSIPEAYNLIASAQITSSPQQQAAPSQGAKPAQRTLTAQEAAQKAAQAQTLPPRNGVSGAGEPALPTSLMNIGALGRIMLHNQQTGRARPI